MFWKDYGSIVIRIFAAWTKEQSRRPPYRVTSSLRLATLTRLEADDLWLGAPSMTAAVDEPAEAEGRMASSGARRTSAGQCTVASV
jgi:hypothetical protein